VWKFWKRKPPPPPAPPTIGFAEIPNTKGFTAYFEGYVRGSPHRYTVAAVPYTRSLSLQMAETTKGDRPIIENIIRFEQRKDRKSLLNAIFLPPDTEYSRGANFVISIVSHTKKGNLILFQAPIAIHIYGMLPTAVVRKICEGLCKLMLSLNPVFRGALWYASADTRQFWFTAVGSLVSSIVRKD